MLEQLNEDYIRTARAFGLSRLTVVMRHALPNALIPSVTVLGLALGDLLYGAVLTETVFGWPGMGAYVVERSEEHTSELQSLMRNSYAVFCLQNKKTKNAEHNTEYETR